MRNMKGILSSFLFSFILIAPLTLFSQPANLGFEAWTTSAQGTTDPDSNWVSFDPDFVGPMNNLNLVSETDQKLSTNVGEGSYSARVQVSEATNYNGTLDGRLFQGEPFTRRPDSFSYLYNSTVAGSDTSLVLFQLTKYDPVNDSTILVGQGFDFITNSTSGWKKQKGEYVYPSSLTPDTLIMAIYADYSGIVFEDGTLGTQIDVDALDPAIGCKVNAGKGDTIQVCENQNKIGLSLKIKGSSASGGKWIDQNGTGALTNGVFDATQVQPGKYYDFDYVVTDRYCDPDTATITAYVEKDPKPVVNTNVTRCIGDSTLNLWNYASANDQSKVDWTDPDSTDILNDSLLMIYQLKASEGDSTYDYILKSSNQCNTKDTLSVTINSPLGGGKDTSALVCGSNDSLSLFAQLTSEADTGGIWYDIDNTGALTNGFFNATQVKSNQPYKMEYTKKKVGCGTDTTELTLNVKPQLEPGRDTTVNICRGNQKVALNQFLSQNAQAGGIWKDTDGSGVLSGSFIKPLNLSSSKVGRTYRYNYVVDNKACGFDSATISVNINQFPNPGLDTTLPVCQAKQNIKLLTKLSGNPDTGGNWLDKDNTGALKNGEFDATQVSAGQQYKLLYVKKNGACSDTAMLTLSVKTGPEPGSDNQVFICKHQSSVSLSNFLSSNADTGGNWKDLDNSGMLSGNSIQPSTLKNSELGKGFDFAYELSSKLCDTLRAVITVTATDTPNAGLGGSVEICEDNNAFELFDELSNNPDTTGHWYIANSGQKLDSSYFDASTVVPGQSYQVIYRVPSKGCAPDSSKIDIEIDNLPNPGKDTTVTVSNTNGAVDLLNYMGGNPDSNGIWTDVDGTGALNGKTFDASAVDKNEGYNFRYTVTSDICNKDSSAKLIVKVQEISGLNTKLTKDVKVFPNPASEKVTIQTGTHKPEKVTLSSMNGKILMSTGKSQIGLTGIEAGSYVITVHFNNDRKVRKQIIKVLDSGR